MKKLLLCFAVAGLGLTTSSYAQLTQDFESSTTPSLPTGWSDVHTGMGNGWQTHSGGDLSFGTTGIVIPSHTVFAFVDDQDAHNNMPAKMASSTFSLASTTGSVYLVYDVWFSQYHLSGTYRTETAWIEFSNDGGSTYSFLDSIKAYGGWITKGSAISSTSANCKVRFCYSDNRINATDTAGIIGIGVDNIKVYVPPTSAVQLTAVTPAAGDPSADFQVVSTGSTTFAGSVYNWGSTTITTLATSYKVGTSSWVSGSATGLSIAPFTSGTFSCTTPYAAPSTASVQNVAVAINLTGDATLTDDSLGTAVNTVPYFPTKRPLFEEPTGTWCGFCVRGIVYMDSIWKAKAGQLSVVSVHNSDPMSAENTLTTNYDATMHQYIGGYPGLVGDRIYNLQDPANAFSAFNVLSTWYGFADMSVSATITGTNLSATAKVKPASNMTGDYRLELIVTEDRVHNASGYDQHNYYSNAYSSGAYGTLANSEYDFNALPFDIPSSTMYFDYVARYTIPDLVASPNGVASSLPASMTAGTTYSYTFANVPVASTWVSNKLRVVALLMDNNSSSITYNSVLNSVNTRWYVGVSDVKAGIQGLRVFPNPATENANVIFDLSNTSNVNISVVDALGRVVYSQAQQMTEGEQNVNIPVTNLVTGVYNVVIATDKGSVSERLSVVK